MAETSANTVFSPSKRPQRGILKNSCSLDRPSEGKIATFDEMNILATYHPEDKDYGHMKIDEPKTPYGGRVCSQCKAQREALEHSGSGGSIVECHHEQDSAFSGDEVEPNTNRLTDVAAELQRRFSADATSDGHNFQRFRRSSFDQNVMGGDSSDEDESEMTEEQKAHRRAFQERRKTHYNEFEKVRLARQLIEKEESDEDEEGNTSKSNAVAEEDENEDEDVAMQDTEAAGDHSEGAAVHFSNDDDV